MGMALSHQTVEGPVVLVIDDDIAMRESLTSLFQSIGLRVKVFGSAPELLQSKLSNAPSCLVLDIRLPGISGLDFQVELAKSGIHIPIIFMTGHGDIPMSGFHGLHGHRDITMTRHEDNRDVNA